MTLPRGTASAARPRVTLLVVDPAATDHAMAALRPLAVALVVPPQLAMAARRLWPRIPVDDRALWREREAWAREHADPARAGG